MNWSAVDSTVRELFRKNGRTQVVQRTTLKEILAREPMPDVAAMTEVQLRGYALEDSIDVPSGASREEIVELIREYKDKLWHARARGFADALEFIGQDGPHPIEIVRNFCTFAQAVRPALLMDASLAQLATICGYGREHGDRKTDGRGTMAARFKRKCEEPIRKAGMKGFKFPFQKTESACDAYSDSAQGNQNRLGRDYLEETGKQKAA